MRVFICGKGGSGKTTVSILMSRILKEKGFKVYILDADESNELIYNLLDVEKPRPLVEYLGGKKKIFKIGEANILEILKTCGEGIELNKLPSDYISYSKDGIGLIVIGKVRKLGEGCACPFNYLTRIFLKNLVLSEKEFIIVDTDAGVEHIGRGVEEAADMIVFIADPSAESIKLAEIMKRVADERQIPFKLLLNKVSKEFLNIIEGRFLKEGLKIDGVINYDNDIFLSCLNGSKLKSTIAYNDVKSIVSNWF